MCLSDVYTIIPLLGSNSYVLCDCWRLWSRFVYDTDMTWSCIMRGEVLILCIVSSYISSKTVVCTRGVPIIGSVIGKTIYRLYFYILVSDRQHD